VNELGFLHLGFLSEEVGLEEKNLKRQDAKTAKVRKELRFLNLKTCHPWRLGVGKMIFLGISLGIPG
jgi:hypothetical protein